MIIWVDAHLSPAMPLATTSWYRMIKLKLTNTSVKSLQISPLFP
jgi:hypothetical protein